MISKFTSQNLFLVFAVMLLFNGITTFGQNPAKKSAKKTDSIKEKKLFKSEDSLSPEGINLNLKYGSAHSYPDTLKWDINKPLNLNVAGLTDANVEAFLRGTKVKTLSKTGSIFQERTLFALLEVNTPGSDIEKLKKASYFKNFPLGEKLRFKTFVEFKMLPYLGKDVKPKDITFKTFDVKETRVIETTDDGDEEHPMFIPTEEDERKWVQKPLLTNPPVLNDHTRWMLDYDMHRQDPIAIWKRTNEKKKTSIVENEGTSNIDKNKAGNVDENKAGNVEKKGGENSVRNEESPANYKVRSSKPFRPAAYRQVLISVRNFHPYRDSLAVSVDYIDRHVEHANLFTSSFNSVFSQEAAATTEDTSAGAKSGDIPDSLQISISISEKFSILKEELKAFYNSKYKSQILDVNVLVTGIDFIKKNMTKELEITDFSESGIVKLAESKASTVESLDEYFSDVHEAIKYFKLITRYNNFESTSFNVQNKDALQITLNRFKDGKSITGSNASQNIYNISGGFKVDFSLGLYGSLLKDNLYTTIPQSVSDTTFFTFPNGTVNRDSITAITQQTRAKIINDPRGKFSVGPAVFSHIYWKTGREINASFTAGLSVDQQALPRFLIGGSLLLGIEKRWVLTYGAAFGPVKDLASGLEEGQVVDLANYPNTTLPTKDVWKGKGFVSLSWNFSGFNIGNSSGK